MKKKLTGEGITSQITGKLPQGLVLCDETKVNNLLKDFIGHFPEIEIVRTEDEVENMIAEPESHYDKILSGYLYNINNTLHTGHGGAKLFYKSILRQGGSHADAGEMIRVNTDNHGLQPLTNLTVTP